MNLADLDEPPLDPPLLRIAKPKRPSRSRSQIHAGWKHRYRGDRAQVEMLAREEDTVVEETMSTGRVRRVRPGHGVAHEYNPFWHDLMLRCIGVLDGWRERRQAQQEFRRRKARHAKHLREAERTRRWLEAQADPTTMPPICLLQKEWKRRRKSRFPWR